MDPDTFYQQAKQQGYSDADIKSYMQYEDQNSLINKASSVATPQMPDDVMKAAQNIGNQKYDDYCQAFVEQQVYGKMGIHPNAVSAWNSYAQNGQAKSGLDGAKQGDLVYFAPDGSNGGNGHTGIITGNNQFVSATNNGVQNYNIDDWQKATGQQVLGYVPIKGGQQASQ